jgi:two-component system sensor histidine kinase PilS (NtrC family)
VLNSFIAKPVENIAAAALFKRQLRWMLFLRVVFLTLLLGITLLLQSAEKHIILPPYNYVAFFIAAVYIYTICSALILKFIKHYSTFAYGQFLGDVLLISMLVYYSGGSQSVFLLLYFFPIIAGSLILFRIGGLAPAAASTIAFGIVLTLEYNGYHPVFFENFWYRPLADIRSTMNVFSIYGLTFFIIAILSSLLSERLRRAEKALITTTLKYDQLSVLYKKIFDDIPSGIITVINQKNIISINNAAEKITGFTSEEIVAKNINKIFPKLKLDSDMSFRSEVEITRKDRKRIPIGYSFAKLNMPGTDDKYEVITLQDLSKTKQMQKQVRQAEKMATLGEMAAGIAHELRSPLSAISVAAEVLDSSGDIKSRNQGLMNIITRECSRLQDSITDFLSFSKPNEPEKEFVHLLPLVQQIIQLLQHTQDWPEKCPEILEIQEKIDCWGDPQQIHKLLLNILHNSCLALKNMEGEIRVSAREEDNGTGSERTVLTITDNGRGIPDLIIDKIYEPFFTTRENGTGLGLSIAKQIVDAHEGGIKIVSRENQGTTVEVWLPLP